MRGGTALPMTPKQLIKLLKKFGFVKISQNGSHLKLCHPISNKIVIVTMHNKDLGKGLEKTILKQAGITNDKKRK